VRNPFINFYDGAVPSILDLPAGLYRGQVEGVESGRCEARFEVRHIPGGCVVVDYEAVGADGVQHVEHTVIAPGALYVAHSESAGVQVFTESSSGVYDAAATGPYSMRLVVGWDDTELTWAWHWAIAGEPVAEQSRAAASCSDE
jgi:hypothetical protein